MDIIISAEVREVLLPGDKRLRLMGPPNTWTSSEEYDRRLAESTQYDIDESAQEEGMTRAAIHKLSISDMDERRAAAGKVAVLPTQAIASACGVLKPKGSYLPPIPQ